MRPATAAQREIQLAHELSRHPRIVSRLNELAGAAGQYMLARAEADTDAANGVAAASEAREEHCSGRLNSLLSRAASENGRRKGGTPDFFAGRLDPADVDALRAVYGLRRGSMKAAATGNLRDCFTQVYRFWSGVLLYDMFGPSARADHEELARGAGLSVAGLRRFSRSACKAAHAAPWQLSPAAVSECSWLPTHALREAMRVPTAAPTDVAALSDRTRAEFLAEGGLLDGRADGQLSPKGEGLLPWLEASKTLTLKADHPWVVEASSLGLPLVGALSHSAAKYRLIADMLSSEQSPSEVVGDGNGCRPLHRSWLDVLCFIAYLVPIRSHSFHEILAAVSMVDPNLSGYQPKHCKEMLNLPPEELLRRCPLPRPDT